MIRKFIPGALALSLAATTSAQTPADSPAKSEATTPPIEVPAKPKLEPAVIKADSSYALGFRTGSTFGQQFGRFGVSADDIQQDTFVKGFMTAVKGDKPELSEEKLQERFRIRSFFRVHFDGQAGNAAGGSRRAKKRFG